MFHPHPLVDALVRGGVLCAAALLGSLLLARVVGLRSLSKMTAFDFVATIASGSLLANAATATSGSSFAQPMAAMFALFGVQFCLAWARQRSDRFRHVVDNRPRLLMRDGQFDEEALRQCRVARSDVLGKLREANAVNTAAVCAVVLETTGDFSVLHGGDVESSLLDGVRS